MSAVGCPIPTHAPLPPPPTSHHALRSLDMQTTMEVQGMWGITEGFRPGLYQDLRIVDAIARFDIFVRFGVERSPQYLIFPHRNITVATCSHQEIYRTPQTICMSQPLRHNLTLFVRESDTQSELSTFPAATYRPSGLSETDIK